MEQLDPARVVVRGQPTDAELAALLCLLAQLSTPPPPPPRHQPRVWRRTSWRSHSHQLHATLPPSTAPGHRALAVHPLEES